MTKLHKLSALFLLLVLFASPLLARAQEPESTEQAPVTVTDGGVVIVENQQPEISSDLSQTEILFAGLLLFSLLVNALQVFYLNKSVPSDLANKIFTGARWLADTTETPEDNRIVDEAEKLYNDLSAMKTERPKD